MNWSQISEEIPSLLVIMSHREWNSGEDGMGKKGGGSQTSVALAILWLLGHVVLILPYCRTMMVCQRYPLACEHTHDIQSLLYICIGRVGCCYA